MAGYYSEAEFTAPSLAPPTGHVWMWFDYNVGSVGWAKISHEDNNSLPLRKAIRAINEFYLQLTNPRDVNGLLLNNSNQKWVIESIKGYPDYGYTLFKIQIDISSNAVTADEVGSQGGSGFGFSATGDLYFPATSSDGELLNGIATAVPQGYFPESDDYPTEQTFRGYNGANYFKEYSVFTNIGGAISDTDNNFKNGQIEINNSNLTSITERAPKNQVPWFMNASFEAVTISDTAITDLSPVDRVELSQLAAFYLSRHGQGDNASLTTICNEGDFDNTSGGKIGVVAASPLLQVENNQLKFKTGTPGSTTATEESLRQRGGGIEYSSQSIIKNGTLSFPNNGSYAIKTGTNGGSVLNFRNIAIIRDNNIVGVYHCPGNTRVIQPIFSLIAFTPDDAFDGVGGGGAGGNIGDTRGIHLATTNPITSLTQEWGEVPVGGATREVANLSDGTLGGRAILSSTDNDNVALGAFYISQTNNTFRAFVSLIDGTPIGGRLVNPPKQGSYSFSLQGTGIVEPITFSAYLSNTNSREITNVSAGANITTQLPTPGQHPLQDGGRYTLTVTQQPK